jgi:hypothetical protein
MQTRPERRKPGRKSKGPRVQVPVRLPTEFYEAVEEIAKQDGIWITDVVTRRSLRASAGPHRTTASQRARASRRSCR